MVTIIMIKYMTNRNKKYFELLDKVLFIFKVSSNRQSTRHRRII
jgi:hypothetical protein